MLSAGAGPCRHCSPKAAALACRPTSWSRRMALCWLRITGRLPTTSGTSTPFLPLAACHMAIQPKDGQPAIEQAVRHEPTDQGPTSSATCLLYSPATRQRAAAIEGPHNATGPDETQDGAATQRFEGWLPGRQGESVR